MDEEKNEFIKDLYELLETHRRFLEDPEYEDYQGDAWDFVLDDMRNIYVKWFIGKKDVENILQ